MGWMGGKYSTSKPMSRTYGSLRMTSSNVPWRDSSSDMERGKSSYQAAKRAATRSTCTGSSRS